MVLLIVAIQKGPNEEIIEPWYSAVPFGNHTLQQMVKKMCSNTGIGGHKTNHSLRATGVTELFKRGAPEKLIPRANRTGQPACACAMCLKIDASGKRGFGRGMRNKSCIPSNQILLILLAQMILRSCSHKLIKKRSSVHLVHISEVLSVEPWSAQVVHP